MSTSDLKLNLMERLALVQDAGFLQRLKQIFDKELGDDDFTEEEFAELLEIDRRRREGLDTYLYAEDAMRMTRESINRRSEAGASMCFGP